MGDVPGQPELGMHGHARWVRISHGIATVSLLTLAFTGVVILMAHPRLYWGEVGNDLTPALVELPISRNYRHGGWATPAPFFDSTAGPISASRTYDIFNQNGWGRSLHFLAAWSLVLPGLVYLLTGMAGGHFHVHMMPRGRELAPRLVWRDVVNHVRFRIPPASGGPNYGVLQKCAYSLRGLRGGAPDSRDRTDHVSGGDGRISVAALAVRRLPVGAYDSFLYIRGAAAVRARPRRNGRSNRDSGDRYGR